LVSGVPSGSFPSSRILFTEVGDVRDPGLPFWASSARKASLAVFLLGVLGDLLVLSVLISPREASAGCVLPSCCGQFHHGSRVAQVEVVAVEPGQVRVRLLETAVYCDDGAACPPAEFPLEVPCRQVDCLIACKGCDALQAGLRAVIWIDGWDLCLSKVLPVEAAAVSCDGRPVPVEFVLENLLDPACHANHVEAGWDLPCDDEEGCAHAGQGGGVVLAVAVLARLARRRRR